MLIVVGSGPASSSPGPSRQFDATTLPHSVEPVALVHTNYLHIKKTPAAAVTAAAEATAAAHCIACVRLGGSTFLACSRLNPETYIRLSCCPLSSSTKGPNHWPRCCPQSSPVPQCTQQLTHKHSNAGSIPLSHLPAFFFHQRSRPLPQVLPHKLP
jgi:hypothetical protein